MFSRDACPRVQQSFLLSERLNESADFEPNFDPKFRFFDRFEIPNFFLEPFSRRTSTVRLPQFYVEDHNVTDVDIQPISGENVKMVDRFR